MARMDGRGRAGSTTNGHSERYYRELWRHTFARLLLIYFAPLLLLAAFFLLQYIRLFGESRNVHLVAVAEHQALTLDLFLRERVVNLSNVIDDPRFPQSPDIKQMESRLGVLRQASEAFVDLGFFDDDGNLLAYAGPYPFLQANNYASEPWFIELGETPTGYLISDIHLGFRGNPHFTIAIRRMLSGRPIVLRATLSPDEILDFLTTLEGAGEVYASVLNQKREYQVVNRSVGSPTEVSPCETPPDPRSASRVVTVDGKRLRYAYAWLKTTSWTLVVRDKASVWHSGQFKSLMVSVFLFTLVFLLLGFGVIGWRAQHTVAHQRETDLTQAELSGQLVHASKLASVGELAAGIAHEINNPLAIIAEEEGLLRDLMDPQFKSNLSQEEIGSHLEIIHSAVFRCRDITRKLLGFVRQTAIKLEHHSLNSILDEVADGILGRELSLSNIRVVKEYDKNLPNILTDRNQLEQVILNIVKNGVDAMGDRGTLTLTTSRKDDLVTFAVSDTGCGIPRDAIEKIFMPFYTTKEIGKGTGLGLSVSYGIIRGFGGNLYVDSTPGQGSTFSIELPLVPPE